MFEIRKSAISTNSLLCYWTTTPCVWSRSVVFRGTNRSLSNNISLFEKQNKSLKYRIEQKSFVKSPCDILYNSKRCILKYFLLHVCWINNNNNNDQCYIYRNHPHPFCIAWKNPKKCYYTIQLAGNTRASFYRTIFLKLAI